MTLGQWMPKEFNRKPQSLLDLCRWKATVLRFFLLYAGPIILNTDIIPEEYICHFNALSCAIRILCHPIDCKKNNNYANELLRYFVKEFKILYGEQFVTSNVHNLIHLAQDVKLYGPLDSFSAFDFENYMQFKKKMLRKHANPLQQIHRRLTENIHPCTKKRGKNEKYPLLLEPINKKLPFNCLQSHRKLQFENFELSNSRHDNCCILDDGSIIVIQDIGTLNEDIIVIGKKFKKTKKYLILSF